MRIAYVLNTYPLGSQSFIRREIQALERQGVEVIRLAMRPPEGATGDPHIVREQQQTEYVLAAGSFRLARAVVAEGMRATGRWFPALCLAMSLGRASRVGVGRHLVYFLEACHVASRCKAEAVDHLHAHFGTNSATVAMLASRISGRPFSFTVHGPEEFDQPLELSLGQKMRASAFTVAISSFGRSQLCRWVEPEYWDRIKVVHCGIEPTKFDRPQPLPDGPIRLVSIGRFAEQKGQALLLDAMARVRSRYPDIHLSLVGDGPLRGQLEADIRRRELQDIVSITGWVDESRVAAELVNSHALVMPSFAEGLPMVVMEAMAAARPIIATYVAGIPELVLPGQTGWLVPAGDAQALAEAIFTLADTSLDRLSEMGKAGRVRALERHDIDSEAGRIMRYFSAAADGT